MLSQSDKSMLETEKDEERKMSLKFKILQQISQLLYALKLTQEQKL